MFSAFLVLLGATSAAAHSWVACTDYRVASPNQAPQGTKDPDPARRKYDDSKCHAYARDWGQYASFFGDDRGYNYISNPTAVCKTTRGDSGDYTLQYPMASYTAGQTVCLAYPAKNHAAAPCTNAFIPDTKFAIYRSAVNANTDPTLAEFQQHPIPHLNGVHQDGVIDYKGFQNCPDFCGAAGTGLATCSVCFQLEDNLAAGKYTFLWYWEFNGGDPYTSCWEANVLASKPGPSPTPKATVPTKPTPKTTPKVTAPPPKSTPKTTPKPPTNGGRQKNCFCPCKCGEHCWHKCFCSHAGAVTKDPFATTAHDKNPDTAADLQPACSHPVKPYGQCGGLEYMDNTCCTPGYQCVYVDFSYSQCQPLAS